MDCIWELRYDGKPQCVNCGWVFPRVFIDDLTRLHRNCGKSETPHQSTPIVVELTKEQRADIIDKMRESIVVMEDGAADSLAQELSTCQQCKTLLPDGCGLPCNCSERWAKWRERIITLKCEHFSKADT